MTTSSWTEAESRKTTTVAEFLPSRSFYYCPLSPVFRAGRYNKTHEKNCHWLIVCFISEKLTSRVWGPRRFVGLTSCRPSSDAPHICCCHTVGETHSVRGMRCEWCRMPQRCPQRRGDRHFWSNALCQDQHQDTPSVLHLESSLPQILCALGQAQ